MPLEQDPSEEAPQGVPASSQEVTVADLTQLVDGFQSRAAGVGVPSAPPRDHKFGRRLGAIRPAFMGGTTTGRPQTPRLGA